MCGDPPETPVMPLTPFSPAGMAPPAAAATGGALAAPMVLLLAAALASKPPAPLRLRPMLDVDEALLGCRSSALLWMLMGALLRLAPNPTTPLPLARSWASAPTPAVLAVTSVFLGGLSALSPGNLPSSR